MILRRLAPHVRDEKTTDEGPMAFIKDHMEN